MGTVYCDVLDDLFWQVLKEIDRKTRYKWDFCSHLSSYQKTKLARVIKWVKKYQQEMIAYHSKDEVDIFFAQNPAPWDISNKDFELIKDICRELDKYEK